MASPFKVLQQVYHIFFLFDATSQDWDASEMSLYIFTQLYTEMLYRRNVHPLFNQHLVTFICLHHTLQIHSI